MIARLSRGLAAVVTERPRAVLAAALLLLIASLPFVMRLRLDTDIYDLFPRDRPATDAFARFSRSFVEEPVIVILAESADPARLAAFVDPFAEALRRSPDLVEVRHRLTGEAARFFRDHLVAFLDDAAIDALADRTSPEKLGTQLRRLRGLLTAPGGSSLAPLLTADPFDLLPIVTKRLGSGMSIDATSGLFRSADGHAVLLYVRPKTTDIEGTRALLESIGRAAAPFGGVVTTDGTFHDDPAHVELSFTGPSVYALHYRDWLHGDMTRATVLSAIAVLLLFTVFFGTRNLLALAGLPLAVGLPLVVGVVWTGAIAHLLFARLNAVSLAFGTILISIGIDLPIQLYNRLREELCEHDFIEALRRSVERFAGPAFLATLGPAAVFLACTISKFRGLRELGALSALGLAVNCIAMLTIFPALLAAMPRSGLIARARAVSSRGPLRSLGAFSSRAPRLMLTIAAISFAASLPGAVGVRFDRALFAQPPLMPPSRVQEELGRRFGQKDGAAIAYVEVRDPSASADELDERALVKSDLWLTAAERLENAGLLRGHQSLSQLVASVATQKARRARLDAIDPAARATAIRAELASLGFDASALDGFLSQLETTQAPLRVRDLPGELGFLVRLHLHRDPGETRVASYLYPVTGAREAEALAAIEAVAQGPAGGIVTGKPLVEPALRSAAERDLLHATILAAVLVALLVALHYRRWRPTVAILVPLLLAWVGFGATLFLCRIPLNLYNLLAVPLVIGYGIDDHVFLLARFEENGHRDVAGAMASTGRAVIVTSLATIAGFLPIAFARFPPLRLLGISAALAVGWCLVAAFVVLPALLTVLWKEDRT